MYFAVLVWTMFCATYRQVNQDVVRLLIQSAGEMANMLSFIHFDLFALQVGLNV